MAMTIADSVAEMRRAGHRAAEVAELLRISVRQVTRLTPPELRKKRSPALSPEMLATIKQRSDEGWPRREIMATYGLNLDQIRHLVDPEVGRQYQGLAGWAARKHNELWHELRD